MAFLNHSSIVFFFYYCEMQAIIVKNIKGCVLHLIDTCKQRIINPESIRTEKTANKVGDSLSKRNTELLICQEYIWTLAYH